MSAPLIVHPEAQMLRLKCEQLRDQLAQLIFNYDQLRCVVIPNLAAEYQVKIGRYEYELFCTQLEIKRRQRTISLLQAAINRRQSISAAQVEAQLAAEYAAWHAQAQQMAAQLRSAAERLANPMNEEDSNELHRLYHLLARRLHPDVNPNSSEHEKRLWQWAKDAYAQGNLDDLRSLVLVVGPTVKDTAPPTTHEGSALEQWRRYTLDLSERVEAQSERIGALERQFPCNERDHLADSAWVASQQFKLVSDLQAAHTAQKKYQQVVDQLWMSLAHE